MIGSDSQQWSTEWTMQMYCSEFGGWLWPADATESYVQGPRTGKCCKLTVENFYYCLVYCNIRCTQGEFMYMYIQSKFPHFSISSNINLQQNGCTPAMTSHSLAHALMNSFVLYVKRSSITWTWWHFWNWMTLNKIEAVQWIRTQGHSRNDVWYIHTNIYIHINITGDAVWSVLCSLRLTLIIRTLSSCLGILL